jgi:hypothetical protein
MLFDIVIYENRELESIISICLEQDRKLDWHSLPIGKD